MSDQTSRLIDVAKSTRDIAYNNGLQADITGTRQQVDALQKRQDISNVHMNEVTRQNEAMNADLKQIGPAIDKAVKAQNKNSDILNRALIKGFYVHTSAVTISVINEFKKLTGHTIDEFLRNQIVKGMNDNIYAAKQAKLTAIQAAQTAEEALLKMKTLINWFTNLMMVLVIELGIIIGVTLVLPSWWKLLGLTGTVIISAVVNHYLKKVMIVGYNLNIDVDNEGKLSLAVQGHLIPSWVYANSQTAHENKRVRLAEIQRQAVLEAQQTKRQKQRLQQKQIQTEHKEQKEEVNRQQQRQPYNRKSYDFGFEY